MRNHEEGKSGYGELYKAVKEHHEKSSKSKALEKAKGGYDVERGRKISHDAIKHVVKKEFRGEKYKQANETYDKMK